MFLHIDCLDQENQWLEILERKGGKEKKALSKRRSSFREQEVVGKEFENPCWRKDLRSRWRSQISDRCMEKVAWERPEARWPSRLVAASSSTVQRDVTFCLIFPDQQEPCCGEGKLKPGECNAGETEQGEQGENSNLFGS